MLYKYLNTNKGFTLTETMITVIVLGILTSIAVPAYLGVSKFQKKQDCKNNRAVIRAVLERAMSGQMDNGAIQKNKNNEFYLDFDPERVDHTTTISYKGETVTCFKLVAEDCGEDDLVFTLGDVRCGYYDLQTAYNDYKELLKEDGDEEIEYFPDGTRWSWPFYVFKIREKDLNDEKYKMGYLKTEIGETLNDAGEIVSYEKSVGYYLKQEKLKDIPFYTYLVNQEIPVCPFSTDNENYNYYILEDATVICSCPYCE